MCECDLCMKSVLVFLLHVVNVYSCPYSGVYWDSSVSLWTDCPAGSFCPDCSNPPELCPKETYSDEGATACTSCPAGKHALLPGSTGCSQCEAGKYWSLFHGASEYTCNDCMIGGVYCPGGDNMLTCPKGTYSNWVGASVCKDCEPGKYQPNPGRSSCFGCTYPCNWPYDTCTGGCYRQGCGGDTIGKCVTCSCPNTNYSLINTCDGSAGSYPNCKYCPCEEFKEAHCTSVTDPVCCSRYSVPLQSIYILSFLLRL